MEEKPGDPGTTESSSVEAAASDTLPTTNEALELLPDLEREALGRATASLKHSRSRTNVISAPDKAVVEGLKWVHGAVLRGQHVPAKTWRRVVQLSALRLVRSRMPNVVEKGMALMQGFAMEAQELEGPDGALWASMQERCRGLEEKLRVTTAERGRWERTAGVAQHKLTAALERLANARSELAAATTELRMLRKGQNGTAPAKAAPAEKAVDRLMRRSGFK